MAVDTRKKLNANGLLYVWQKIKETFVAKETGKGLSTNDLTDELKQKILESGSGSFTGDYNDLINKPTLVSTWTNDSGYQTATQVQSAIDTAVGSTYKVKGSCKTAELPATGRKTGDVWNLTDDGVYGVAGTNVVYTGSAWDALAGTYDMSGYATSEDVAPLTNSDIDTICV